jgi:3-dehydroquinate dehydratase I
MRKTIKVKGLTIGEGIPKICVSLMGRSQAELLNEAQFIKTLDIDVVEWRVDYFEDVEDISKVKSALNGLRLILSETPFLFTFRSKKEGGEKEISNEYYFDLITAIIETKKVDLIDIELFNEETNVKKLVEISHSRGVFVIISNHDFTKTPPKDEIITRLSKAQELGADIPKIALMPKNSDDVLNLLDATNTMNKHFSDTPIITISMGGKGAISRLTGELFGSAMTFAAGRKGSAPGQLSVSEVRNMLNILHGNLKE